jgi:hypothetical protein
MMMEWIDVKKSLPKKGKRFFVKIDDQDEECQKSIGELSECENCDNCFMWEDVYGDKLEDVTHWLQE